VAAAAETAAEAMVQMEVCLMAGLEEIIIVAVAAEQPAPLTAVMEAMAATAAAGVVVLAATRVLGPVAMEVTAQSGTQHTAQAAAGAPKAGSMAEVLAAAVCTVAGGLLVLLVLGSMPVTEPKGLLSLRILPAIPPLRTR
jgi:hypothetical protein